MRILVFAALLGSGLCAQTPPVKPFEPSPEPQAAIPVQPSNPAGNHRFFSLPTPVIVTPNKGGPGLPAIIPYVPGRVTLAPGRACAIPLLHVVPKAGFNGDPKIAIMGPQTLANIDHMPLIQALPVCPQGQR